MTGVVWLVSLRMTGEKRHKKDPGDSFFFLVVSYRSRDIIKWRQTTHESFIVVTPWTKRADGHRSQWIPTPSGAFYKQGHQLFIPPSRATSAAVCPSFLPACWFITESVSPAPSIVIETAATWRQNSRYLVVRPPFSLTLQSRDTHYKFSVVKDWVCTKDPSSHSRPGIIQGHQDTESLLLAFFSLYYTDEQRRSGGGDIISSMRVSIRKGKNK